MSTPEDRWPKVQAALAALGLSEKHKWRVGEIRSRFDEHANQGIYAMPDFTLHNVTHSDNIILLFAQLKAELNFNLSEYEFFLFAASAYLHDLGMFYNQRKFEIEVAPDIDIKLGRFCPQDKCDRLANYELDEGNSASQIRAIHHLLTAYWLLKSPEEFELDTNDLPYLMTICRGHRGANLCETECDCYKNTRRSGETIQIGVITGLLRLCDALDFYDNRAPEAAFNDKAYDLLLNPTALSHWIRHYFVADPYITIHKDRGNSILECQLVVVTPLGDHIGNKTYQEFLLPLFEEHMQEANKQDLRIQGYPPTFLKALGISEIQGILKLEERRGFKKIPQPIMDTINSSKSPDIVTFLQNKHRSRLRRKKHKHILVLCPMFGASSVYYSHLLTAITHCIDHYDDCKINIQPISDVKAKLHLQDYADLSTLDGVIAITCEVESSTWLKECKEEGIPLALIHDNVEEDNLKDTTVIFNLQPELNGLHDLVKHLISSHQRRNICVVMVNPHGHRIRQRKLDIIQDAVREEELDFLDVTDDKHLFVIREYTHEEGQAIAREILLVNPTVDAVICLADTTAVGVLQEMKERKREDILVTGFDNVDLAARSQLTSVDQQLRDIGERAVTDLYYAIQHGVHGYEGPVFIPTTLIARESCCKRDRSPFRACNPIQRLQICCPVDSEEVVAAIANVYREVYHPTRIMRDSAKPLTGSPLAPPHIALRGIFQLKPQENTVTFLDEFARVASGFDRFSIKVKELALCPDRHLSLLFGPESIEKLQDVQRRVLPIIDAFRNCEIIEPEYQNILAKAGDIARCNIYQSGDPSIGDNYFPYLAIMSGVEDQEYLEQIKGLVKLPGELELEIKTIAVLYETMLGGSWEILREIPLV